MSAAYADADAEDDDSGYVPRVSPPPPLAYLTLREDEEKAAKEREQAAVLAANARPAHAMPWFAYLALLLTAVAGVCFIIYGAVALARN